MGRGVATSAAPRRAPPARQRERPLGDAALRLIWRERQMSRAEIARQMDLSRSTVSELVGELLETGLVAEVGTGQSRGGRRPIVLEFQDDAGGILGVDIGATHVGVAITDLRGRLLTWKKKGHPVRTDPEGTRKLVVELADACLATWGGGTQRLVGIGVALPSPVDPNRPDRLSEVVMPAWRGRSGLEDLSLRYGVPVLVDNDANLGALAERWWGAGRDVDDFTFIKLATGIGAGHILRGEIYRGATGVAGEIGHMAIDTHGPPCVCGNRGCLATFAGAHALVARTRTLLADHPESTLSGKELTIAAIEDAALAGDPLSRQVMREAAEYLGIAVAGMANVLNPGLVILGGGLVRLGDLLLEPLRDTVGRRTLVSSISPSQIRTSELGPQVFVIGAATLVLDAALTNPRLFRGVTT